MTPMNFLLVLVATVVFLYVLELPVIIIRFIKAHAESGTVRMVVGVFIILVVSLVLASLVVYPETTMMFIQGLMSLAIIGGVIAIVCKMS
jgi:hypothetical protein